MLIQDFSGGLNTRVTPSLLQPNEAQIYTNIDNSSGPLLGVKDSLDTGIVIPEYYTYFVADNEWFGQSEETSFVEYNDKLYYSDGVSALKVRRDFQSKDLGIDAPGSKPEVEFINILDNKVSFSSTIEDSGLSSGAISYYITVDGNYLYNKIIPYTVGNNDLDKHQVTITIASLKGISTSDIVTLYRQYKGTYYEIASDTYSSGMTFTDSSQDIGANRSVIPKKEKVYTYCCTYYNEAEGIESSVSPISNEVQAPAKISNIPQKVGCKTRLYRLGGDILDYTLVEELTETNFIDYTDDLDIAGNIVLNSIENTKPIIGMQYLGEAYAMLFATKGSKLYYSEIGKPYAWPATNFIDFPDTITGWGAVSTGLFVFTKYKTYIVTGNSPETFSRYLLSGDQGCVNHNTVQFTNNNLLWMSTDGLCSSSGGVISVITLAKVGKLSFNTINSSAVLDSAYYLNYSDAFGSHTIVFDFRYNQVVRKLDLEGRNLLSARDNLYQYYNGTLQRLFATSPLPIHYKSPILTEGSYSNFKHYKDIYIRYNGTASFKIYIDGILSTEIQLSGNTTTNVKLSKQKTSGYGIEFEIEGDVVVYEIAYNVTGRQKV